MALASKEAEAAGDDFNAVANVRHVAGRTFYLLGEVWTDSEFDEKEAKVTEVIYGSKEYFDLARNIVPAVVGFESLKKKVEIMEINNRLSDLKAQQMYNIVLEQIDGLRSGFASKIDVQTLIAEAVLPFKGHQEEIAQLKTE